MPEMPEMQGLADFLGKRAVGTEITAITITAISGLKTFDPPVDVLRGARIVGVHRHGKFIDILTNNAASSPHLVFHLAKAGWLRWYEKVPTTVVKPGRSPIAARVTLDDSSGFDLTEAGTRKSLSIWVTSDPHTIPGIARLGPDPLSPDFTIDVFARLLEGRRMQIKGLLRDQSVIAGIGNAYSDEILHVAELSPYAIAGKLAADETLRLYDALRSTLIDAVDVASGAPPAALKDAKRRGMRVHGRRGEACPVCGDIVRSVFFARYLRRPIARVLRHLPNARPPARR